MMALRCSFFALIFISILASCVARHEPTDGRANVEAVREVNSIGVYSGTFDPPHKGHAALIARAIQNLKLDLMYVIPNVTSEHKPNVSAYLHRAQMARIAFGRMTAVRISDAELEAAFQKEDMNGVITTISKRHPNAAHIDLCMGADSYERFVKVKKAIVPGLEVFVSPRAGSAQQELPKVTDGIPTHWLDNSVDADAFSSSKVRESIRAGKRPVEIEDDVWKYIQANKLYGAH